MKKALGLIAILVLIVLVTGFIPIGIDGRTGGVATVEVEDTPTSATILNAGVYTNAETEVLMPSTSTFAPASPSSNEFNPALAPTIRATGVHGQGTIPPWEATEYIAPTLTLPFAVATVQPKTLPNEIKMIPIKMEISKQGFWDDYESWVVNLLIGLLLLDRLFNYLAQTQTGRLLAQSFPPEIGTTVYELSGIITDVAFAVAKLTPTGKDDELVKKAQEVRQTVGALTGAADGAGDNQGCGADPEKKIPADDLGKLFPNG